MSQLKKSEEFTREREREISQVHLIALVSHFRQRISVQKKISIEPDFASDFSIV